MKSRASALQGLLLDAFSNDELVAFLRADDATKAVVRAIPSLSVAPEKLAMDVVAALERRGLVNATLFDRLGRERPSMHAASTAVRERFSITTTPRAPPAPADALWDFFLVHASADKPSAEALYAALAGNARVFLDSRSIAPGAVWPDAVQRALMQSRVVVVLASERTNAGHYALDEIASAIDQARLGNATLVPVWLDGRPATVYGLRVYQGIVPGEGGISGVAEALLRLIGRPHALDLAPRAAGLQWTDHARTTVRGLFLLFDRTDLAYYLWSGVRGCAFPTQRVSVDPTQPDVAGDAVRGCEAAGVTVEQCLDLVAQWVPHREDVARARTALAGS